MLITCTPGRSYKLYAIPGYCKERMITYLQNVVHIPAGGLDALTESDWQFAAGCLCCDLSLHELIAGTDMHWSTYTMTGEKVGAAREPDKGAYRRHRAHRATGTVHAHFCSWQEVFAWIYIAGADYMGQAVPEFAPREKGVRVA